MSSKTGTSAAFGSENPVEAKKSDGKGEGKADELYGIPLKSEGTAFEFAGAPVQFGGAPVKFVGAGGKVEGSLKGNGDTVGALQGKVGGTVKGGDGAGSQQGKDGNVFYDSVYDSSGDLPDDRATKKRRF